MFSRLFRIRRADRRPLAGDEAARDAVARAVDTSSSEHRRGARPDADRETRWRVTVKQRVLVVLCVLGVWSVILEGRLVHLQIFKHDEMVARARDQQYS